MSSCLLLRAHPCWAPKPKHSIHAIRLDDRHPNKHRKEQCFWMWNTLSEGLETRLGHVPQVANSVALCSTLRNMESSLW